MPYFDTEDKTRLFYSVCGRGKPILLIHGGNVGSEMDLFASLAHRKRIRCIAYDQRGFAQ